MRNHSHPSGESVGSKLLLTWGLAVPLVWMFATSGIPCAGQTPAETTPPATVTDAPAAAAPSNSADSPPPDRVNPTFDVLEKARKYVDDYFEKFSDLTCKETVTQLVLNGSGHTLYRENSAYDYQFELASKTGPLKFTETRENRNPAFRDPARTLRVTTGFSSLLLIVHPMYEASYVFEPAGNETVGGVSYSLIRFTPVAGTASPASLRLRGKNYGLPMSGTLWVEPASGAIVKLEAKVDSSLSDLGLAGLRSEVHYVTHTFHNPEQPVWIADSAVIDVATPHQHWRNLHRFTEYKRFNVNVHEEIGQAHE